MIDTKLPNGAIILAIHIGPRLDGVVMAYVREGEWATWAIHGNDLRTTHTGHYFRDIDVAFADYVERVARERGYRNVRLDVEDREC